MAMVSMSCWLAAPIAQSRASLLIFFFKKKFTFNIVCMCTYMYRQGTHDMLMYLLLGSLQGCTHNKHKITCTGSSTSTISNKYIIN